VSPREGNLRLLRDLHPEIPRSVLDSLASGSAEGVTIEAASTGDPTAVYGGVYAHSRYDPRREAVSLCAREVSPDVTAGIVLGFGLGYAAEAFRERFPFTPLLVVEPDAELFRAALASRDLAKLLASAGTLFHLAAAPEEITPLLERLPMEKPQFLRLRPVMAKRPAYFRAVEEIARSFLLRRDININTLNRFGRLWVRNLASNLPRFVQAAGVSTLAGLFEGLPALLLAGGPSLDGVLPLLGELAARMLVVAVDTPLRACLAAGLKPDFVVMVDPQYWATRYLDWTDEYDGFVVAEPSTNPRAFRGRRRFILSSSLFPLGEVLEKAVGEKGKLGAGGSVSTSAWDLCRLLGVRSVYAAGLDLGFPGLRTHCTGAFFEELWHSLAGRLAPAEGHAFRSLREIGIFPMPSNGAGSTMTDRRMVLYKWWFESQIAASPQMASFSLSENAVAVKGMSLARIEEALGLPPIRDELDRRLEKARRLALEAGGLSAEERAERLAAAVRGLVGDLREIQALGRRGLSATRELETIIARRGDRRRTLARLDGIDRRILELSSRNVAGFLIQPLIHRILGTEARAASEADVLAASSEMYSGVAESARFQAEVLERAAARLPGSLSAQPFHPDSRSEW
jgi:hypothetical protein